jgi:hypothetical protein
MAGGDLTYRQKHFGQFRVDYDLATGTDGTVLLLAAKSANHRIIISHIIVAVTTYSNKTLSFEDSASTPVKVGFFNIPSTANSTPGLQEFVINFIGAGSPLTVGKNLNLVLSAAGVGARVHIEGYHRLVGPVTIAQASVGG